MSQLSYWKYEANDVEMEMRARQQIDSLVESLVNTYYNTHICYIMLCTHTNHNLHTLAMSGLRFGFWWYSSQTTSQYTSECTQLPYLLHTQYG